MGDFFARKQFHYKAQVQRADGQIIERDVHCYWTPDKDYVLGAVAGAAAALAAFETRNEKGQCIPHVGLSAVLAN